MNISCIVPVYNGEEYIKECINSLKNQTFSDYEIIVIDDGSTDATIDILKNIDDINVVRIEHSGVSIARNTGLKEAKADIVFFVEADAKYSPNFLSNCFRHFKDPKVGGVIGKLEVWNKDSPWTRCRNAELNARFSNYKPFTGWMYRKDLLEKIGGFDEKLSVGEDRDVGRKVQELGYKIVYEPNAIWYHREPSAFSTILKKRFTSGIEAVKFYKIIGAPIMIITDIFAFACVVLSIIFKPLIILFIGYLMAHLFFVRRYFYFVDKKSLWLYLPIYLITGRLAFVIGRFIGLMKYGIPSKISRTVID